jgi:hypothetical protein
MGTGIVRIDGGFIGIEASELIGAWRACRATPLGIGDFRAWLAAREMLARRQGSGSSRSPRYGVDELAKLLGVTERTANATIRRLVRAGLVEWSESAIAFPSQVLGEDNLVADTIGRGGRVALPRRMVRLLTRGARPALIAVALGAVLRCLSRRRSGIDSRGRFKSSWVAETFGVSERQARSARAELVASGWLEPEGGDQWAWNRWGRVFRVRLDWSGPVADRPSPPADPGVRSSYPDQTPIPYREEKHPDPARRGPAGASLVQEGKLPAPTLRNIRAEDLADPVRTAALLLKAVEQGLVPPGESGEVRFRSAVEHSRRVGKDPCALLARIVRDGLWRVVTQQDEDRAARRLREHRRPVSPAPTPRPASAPSPMARSPYAQGPTTREPSALGDLLARLTTGPGPIPS